MPRNSLGVYTVPPGTPAVPLTTISSSAYNAFLNDISAAITQSVATTGISQMTGGLKINLTGASQPPDASATPPDLIHVSGATGQPAAITIDSMNSSGAYLYLRSASGSWSSPQAPGGAGNLGGVAMRGFTGSGWSIVDAAAIYFGTPAQWNAGGVGYPSWIKFLTTASAPGANPAVAGVIQSSGGWNIGDVYSTQTQFDPGAGSLLVQNKIIIAPTTSQVPQVALPTPLAGTLLQAGALSGTGGRAVIEVNASAASIAGRRSNGSWGSPTAVGSGQALMAFQALGHDGNYTTTANVGINLTSANAWTPSDHSAQILIFTTPLGSTTITECTRFQPSGGLSVGNATFNATDPGQGVIAAQNAVQLPQGAPVHDNRVINGNFDVWQLGTSLSVANNSGAYTADQWMANNNATGVTVSVTKGGLPAGFVGNNCINLSGNGVVAAGYCEIVQRFEAAQIADLDSKSIVLSFDLFASTSAGTLTGLVYCQTNSAPDNGSWSTLNWAPAFTVTAGSSQRVAVPIAGSANAGLKNGAVIGIRVQQNGSAANLSVSIGAVQLTKGPVAQPWAPKGVAREIADCQRFFEKSYDLATAPGTATAVGVSLAFGGISTATAWTVSQSITFKASKRVDPTVTMYSPTTGSTGKVRDAISSVDIAGSAGGQGNNGFYWSATASASNAAFNINAHWTADARL